nr:unnamed protein product [Timema douglasi]
MRSNVNKILERGDRLEDLQDASERLNTASVDFQSAANRMRRRAWIQHMKTRAILGGIVALVLICLIVPIIVYYTSSEKTV